MWVWGGMRAGGGVPGVETPGVIIPLRDSMAWGSVGWVVRYCYAGEWRVADIVFPRECHGYAR